MASQASITSSSVSISAGHVVEEIDERVDGFGRVPERRVAVEVERAVVQADPVLVVLDRVREPSLDPELRDAAFVEDPERDEQGHAPPRQHRASDERRIDVDMRRQLQVGEWLVLRRGVSFTIRHRQPQGVRRRTRHPDHGVGPREPLRAPGVHTVGVEVFQTHLFPVVQPDPFRPEPDRGALAEALAPHLRLGLQDPPFQIEPLVGQRRQVLADLHEERLDEALVAGDHEFRGECAHGSVQAEPGRHQGGEGQVFDDVADAAGDEALVGLAHPEHETTHARSGHVREPHGHTADLRALGFGEGHRPRRIRDGDQAWWSVSVVPSTLACTAAAASA